MYHTAFQTQIPWILADEAIKKRKRGRTSFPLDYKLRLVEEAKMYTNRYVARTHGIDESSVRSWRKQEEQLRIACSVGRMYKVKFKGKKE